MTASPQQATQETVAVSARAVNKSYSVVLLAVYLVLLAWIVLWKLQVPWVGVDAQRVVKLVPFAPSAGAGASESFELVVNLVIFVPFGLYLGLLAQSWPLWKVASVLAGSSLVLEVAQYVLAVGRSDVTDVVVNTAGGLAGTGLLVLARRRLQERTAGVMIRVCSIVTVLAVLASGTFLVASPLRYGPPPGLGHRHGPSGDDRTGVPPRVNAPGPADVEIVEPRS